MKDRDYVTTFRIYIGLKQHFNPANDFVYKTYENFKRIGVDTLLKRKDKTFFVDLTKKCHPNQYEYILSMFLKDRNMWVGDMLSKTNQKYHDTRISRLQQLEFIVKADLEQLMTLHGNNFNKLLDDNYDMPTIAKHNYCCLETLAVVNKIKNYTSEETINPLWNEQRHLISAYSKLLNVNNNIKEYLEDLILKT